jgi:predicted nucleic acid-binding Zn ribbon protein
MRPKRAAGPLEPVGPLLQRLLRRLGLDRRLEEYRAVETWPEVVGPVIAAQTKAVSVREGVLFVDVASSVWMQELGMLRDSIVERLNARLGGPRVRKIVLSIARERRAEDEPLAPGVGEVEGPHDE